MPLFICENCGCIENTALGHYWSRKYFKFKDEKMNDKALCSECKPLEFSDGSKAGNVYSYTSGFVFHKTCV